MVQPGKQRPGASGDDASNHSELVILHLLSTGAAHAYELNKRIEAMQLRQWARVGSSTIYRVLKTLSEKGFVRSQSADGESGRPRTVYSITDPGRKRLEHLAENGLSSRQPLYSDHIVSALFAPEPSAAIEAALEACITRLEASMASLEVGLQTPGLSPQGRILIRFQTRTIAAEGEALRAIQDMRASRADAPSEEDAD